MQRSSHTLDRLGVVFDDDKAVASGGLLLPMSLAEHLGVRDLIDASVDLRDAPGHANVGMKAMGLIASALAGGDSIDDADVLRSGRCAVAIGQWMPAPSTLGTYLRSYTWGDCRSLDSVAAEVLRRAWHAGAGPGDGPLTIDMDSSITEVYGTAKQGAAFGHTKVRGYHWLMATTAGAGDVGGRARQGRQCPHRAGGQELPDRGVQPRPGGRGVGAAHPAGRLWLLLRQGGRRLHQGQGRLLHHGQDVQGPPTPPSAPSLMRAGRRSRTSWPTGPTWPRPPTGPSARKRLFASSCAGSGPPPARSSRCSPATATTPSSPTGWARPSPWRPTTAATPRSSS